MKKLLFLFLIVFGNIFQTEAQQNNFSENYEKYIPEIKNFYQTQPKRPNITLSLDVIKAVRKAMDKPAKTVLSPSQMEIDGPYGKIGLRIFKPQQVEAVYLNIHGGGHIWGSAMSDDLLNDEMARKCKMAVVSVEYHLAPEYPFPAQVLDCNAAAKWIITNAQKEFGTDKIFIGGGSAGAQLAALTVLYVRDSLKAADNILGVGLHHGLFDLGLTPSHRNATDSTWGLNKQFLNELLAVICGNMSHEERQKTLHSPLYANLNDLPPAFFMVGNADAFLDDTLFMESRWRMAANKTYLAVFPYSAHGFNALPLGMANEANELFFKWVNERILQSK